MAVAFLDTFPGWSTRFEPLFRKEQSRHASGRTRTKNLGDSIWFGEWQSSILHPNAIDHWRAVLQSIEQSDGEFEAYSMSRTRPILHPTGVAVPGSLTVGTIGTGRNSLSLSGASGLKLRPGDLLQVGTNNLFRVNGSSDNGASVAVVPPLWPGIAGGNAVAVLKPKCYMTIVPGSVQTQTGIDGRGTINFQGTESRG